MSYPPRHMQDQADQLCEGVWTSSGECAKPHKHPVSAAIANLRAMKEGVPDELLAPFSAAVRAQVTFSGDFSGTARRPRCRWDNGH